MIPVIKLELGPKFNNLNVDITFQDRAHSGINCTHLIQQFLHYEPLLKPLTLILKQLIQAHELNDPYTGGIGSYAVTLLTIALLQVMICIMLR